MPVSRIIGGVFLLLLLQSLPVSLSLLISAPSSSSSSPTIRHKMESTSTTALRSASTSTASTLPTLRHQIPVDETGVSLLRRALPTADGRHVRLAILDTGCDLAARGLQTTTLGTPKYLDFIDCTGDGDIDMRTLATVKVENNTATVTGVSGKLLSLPYDIFGTDAAAAPQNSVRVGAIALYQILPKTALKRVQAQQKAQFLQRHNARIAQAQYELDRLLLLEQQSSKEKSNNNDKKESNTTNDKEESNNSTNNDTVTTQDDSKVTKASDTLTKDDANTTTTAKNDATTNNNKPPTTPSATVLLKKQIKEAQLLLEELQDMTKDYSDSAGPVMDVVLYETTTTLGETNDTTTTSSCSSTWQALIDIDATGDLSKATPMAPYAVHHQFSTLGFGSHVTFCVQVYDKGDILSLVCDSGSHGTHVAGIAAANYDDCASEKTATATTTDTNTSSSTTTMPQANGVAPGAQILACKIGDVRVASAETGTGLIRALAAAKRYNCHLINLSFGEPSWQPDSGRVAQVFEDAVYKWGMTVFTSAGNDGPALSTLGSPGTLSSLITVGAYISPQMMVDQYSTLMDTNDNNNNINDGDDDDDNTDGNSLPAASYSFSSRGPTPDGRLPDICAPGGAIAPVPRHTLQSKSQKHGTSMASPSACGVAAVLLSALKEKGIDIDDATVFGPNELRRALVNSAIQTPDNHDSTTDSSPTSTANNNNKIVLDPFAQGAGLVSAPRALKYALAHHGKLGQDLAFDVKISNARGIFIRDALQLAGPMTKTVSVRPLFEHSLQKSDEEMDQLLSLELALDLIPSHDWVQCPDRITLLSAKERGAGQTFSIRLDPRRLPPGAHYATVNAIDSNDPERGPLFQVPITVIVPHTIVNTPPFSFADNGNVVPSTQILGSEDAKKQNKRDISIAENGIDVSMRYELTPGSPERRFLSVPALAEWATIKIRSATPIAGRAAPHSLILHAVPFARGDLHNQMVQIKQFFSLNEGTERSYHVHVKGGSTLEICLQLSWLANASPASVLTDVEFHSFHVRPPNFMTSQPVRISSALEFARFGVGAPFRSEKINPKATLTAVHRTIRPKEYKISAASFDADRDNLPVGDAEKRAAAAKSSSSDGNEEKSNVEGKLVYKSLMKYTFKLAESKDDATLSVAPRIPSLFLQLYDSPVDSQLWMLQDENEKVLGYGACIHEAAAVSLNNKSGAEYTLTLRISHPNRAVLEQLKDLPLRLSMKLSKELECPVYSTLDKASTPGVTDDGREQVKIGLLRQGAHTDLYVTRPTAKLPDWVQHGDVMYGNIKLNPKSEGATSLDLFYEVPPKSAVTDANKKKDDKKDNGKDEKKSLEDELADSIFRAKVDHLGKLRKKKSAEAYQLLANELKAEKPDSLLLLEELLTNAKEAKPPEGDAVENESRWQAVKVTEAVDAMKDSSGGPIDEAAIAQYYGCNNSPSPDDAEEEDDQPREEREKTKKEMEERRKAWRSALLAKAGAWSDLLMSSEEDCSEEDKAAFEGAIQDMKKWVSTASDLSSDEEKARHAVVIACHMRICQGRIVGALSSLRKARKELPGKFYKQITEELVKVLKKVVGMEYWLEQVEKDLAERYPKAKAMLI